MENLSISINDKEFEVSFDKDSDSIVYVNNKKFDVELLKRIAPDVLSFSVNSKICQVQLNMGINGSNSIAIDGFTHDIVITDETQKLIKQFIKDAGGAESSSAKLKSPMPGMVIKILVEEGMQVNKGDKVIIIEAMKMENAISSPISGTIRNIKVKEGTPVEKDALMMEVEG